MLRKLQNFTFYHTSAKRSFALPHRKIMMMCFMIILILVLLSLLKVFESSQLTSEIKRLNVQKKMIKKRISTMLDRDAVGFLKSQYVKEKDGFYPYFQYLSTFKMQGVWLRKLTVAYKGAKKPFVAFWGDADRPESLQNVLSGLAQSDLYINPLMRISSFSVLGGAFDQQSKGNKNGSKGQILRKSDFNQLYQFEITNDSLQQSVSHQKTRRR